MSIFNHVLSHCWVCRALYISKQVPSSDITYTIILHLLMLSIMAPSFLILMKSNLATCAWLLYFGSTCRQRLEFTCVYMCTSHMVISSTSRYRADSTSDLRYSPPRVWPHSDPVLSRLALWRQLVLLLSRQHQKEGTRELILIQTFLEMGNFRAFWDTLLRPSVVMFVSFPDGSRCTAANVKNWQTPGQKVTACTELAIG